MVIKKYTVCLDYQYCDLKRDIEKGLNGLEYGIEHIGITSAPKSESKDIIDIDIIYNNESMKKMKAILCTRYGGPEVLEIEEIAKPSIGHDEILVRIHYSAVTASDINIRQLKVPGDYAFLIIGLLRLAMRAFIGFRKPRNPILGLVFSGEIVEQGKRCQKFKIGDKVFGFTGLSRGAYAEFKSITRKEIKSGEVFLSPNNASQEEAAAIIYGGIMAQHALSKTKITKGDKILIYGASGAIGTMAIQIVKHHQAQVTAICSRDNFDLVNSLGADKVHSYKEKNTIDQLEHYDLILDTVGEHKTSIVKEALKRKYKQTRKYISVDDSLLKIQPIYLKTLKTLFEIGAIKAVIDRKYAMNKIVKAHTYVDKGHKKGNVLIELD